MIVIGHKAIPFKAFERIESKEDVSSTSSHATVLFDLEDKNITLCHYLSAQGVGYALVVKSAKEVIFANALGASFIVCDKALCEVAQKYADSYLFDAKILLLGEEEDIVYAADRSIDGILFKEGVI